jgi:hypothetical protein
MVKKIMANYLEEIKSIMDTFKDNMFSVVAKLNNAITDDMELIREAHKRVVENGKISGQLSEMFDDLADDMAECANSLGDASYDVEDYRISMKEPILLGYIDDEEMENQFSQEDEEDEDEEDFECDCDENCGDDCMCECHEVTE